MRNSLTIITPILILLLMLSDFSYTDSVQVEIVPYATGSTISQPEVHEISRRYVTEYEYNLLLRVCMSECGGRYGEPMEGKIAVVETILNRVDLGYGSISQVVASAYSTANNGMPDESCVEAVESALCEDMYPDNMLFFRTGHYHGFGIPYEKIGNHYFSLLGGV